MGVDAWIRDLALVLRGLVRRPALALGAVVTLGIGVGANVALVSALHDVVLRSLPYEEPDRLAAIYTPWENRELGGTWGDVAAIHRDASTVSMAAGVLLPGMDTRMVIDTEGGREPVEGILVSPNFFTVLGVSPELGSGVQAGRPLEDIEPSVYLSHGAWLRRFGGDPGVVGRTLELQRIQHRIAGVLPEDFDFRLGAASPEIFALRTPEDAERDDDNTLVVAPVARMVAGASLSDLRGELERMSPELDEKRAEGLRGIVLQARPLHEHLVGDVDRPLTALAVAGALVLLVACANLATLFLARHVERAGDEALRVALGAGRLRVARFPLLEALVLGVVGGAVGLAGAAMVTRFVVGMLPALPFRFDGLQVGPSVVALTLLFSVVAGFGFGGIPAWRASRIHPAGVLRSTGRRSAGGGDRTTRILMGVEAAGLVLLLVATGLSLRSLDRLLSVDLGFEVQGRATLTLLIPGERAANREVFTDFLNALDERLRQLPEIDAAGTITHLPLDAESWGGGLYVEGEAPSDEPVATEWELASPGYFEAAGIRLLQGRVFQPEDGDSAPLVTIVSRSLAERIRPDGSALGMRISDTGPEGPFREIVGVVGDVRQQGLDAPSRPFIYVPHGQMFPFPERALVVSTQGDPMAALSAATTSMKEMEPDLAVASPRPLEDLVDRASGSSRAVAVLLSMLGLASLLLALTGVYGVTAFAMARRQRELGIRACLGASRGDLLRRALASAVGPVAAGVAAGMLLVIMMAPRAGSLIYGVGPLDPVTLATVPALLLSAAVAAALAPARRAAYASPADVVRDG